MGWWIKRRIWVFLDNEGPQTKNDNAQENMVALAEACGLGSEVGAKFYAGLSNIDDIWGDFGKVARIDPSYSSGHTLKVALPFYKAMGATVSWLENFARQSLRVVPHIAEVLKSFKREYNVWMISTSYEFFIRAFCQVVGFDFTFASCTYVKGFDEISINAEERKLLLDFMVEVSRMPIIEYDRETGEIVPEHQVYYDRFTNFIWQTVYNMPVGSFMRRVHPVGQLQKMESVSRMSQDYGISRERILYAGDSQTDLAVVQWLLGKGLTMMFNGKGRVCGYSDLMYIGEDARAILEVADRFAAGGRQAVIDYYIPGREAEYGGLLAAVTPENVEELERLSVQKRKEFRGVHIGSLT